MKWEILIAINRIKMLFQDDLGNQINATGTGFWINIDENIVALVTNKHNVAPNIVSEKYLKYKFEKIEIELREILKKEDGKGKLQLDTKFHHVEFEQIIAHDTADVAILIKPLDVAKRPISPFHISQEEIADRSYFEEAVGLCDEANFAGFATYSRSGKKFELWDKNSNLPVLRPSRISSVPHFDFKNDAIQTSDVCLVSGLSFSGSSGSPVFSRQKDVAFDHETQRLHGGIAKAKLIGIMSGHIWDQPQDEEIHSGISYFTKSTAILDLIEAYRTNNFHDVPP